MSPAEDAYGLSKRLAFCTEIIASRHPALVLDVGCGTGENLTRPLAERFPAVRFLGVDDDPGSIAYAKSRPLLPNLAFAGYEALAVPKEADLVIASEVVEHVEAPEVFLSRTAEHLRPDGRMIVTTPNGYGPFELASLFEVLLRLSGAFDLLRRVKRALIGGHPEPESRDTLAASPHINFFSHGRIRVVFASSGLQIERYQGRTLLCGFGLDSLVRTLRIGEWNARVADRLPPACVSAWAFLLRKVPSRPGRPYHRGPFARWRRRMNERCWSGGSIESSAR